MKPYQRKLVLKKFLGTTSLFLFGPRSTGKTSLILNQFPKAPYYDLLSDQVYERLLRHPETLGEEIESAKPEIVIIDEIQKLPKLLDEVHRIIFKTKTQFLLTGSSARKLKRGGANLLGGRARQTSLYPLVSTEISDFDLIKYLNVGGLPHIWKSENPSFDLKNYLTLYLREEVQAEALTRKIEDFLKFLDLMGFQSGEELNLEEMASDVGISAKTIRNYLQILEDTLIGFYVPSFTKTTKRKAISRAKFFLFDVGITNSLAKRGQIIEGSELFGKTFEHFIALEIRAYLTYSMSLSNIEYWRSTTGFEVDFIIGNIAIEVKSTPTVDQRDCKGLQALHEENIMKRFIIVSRDLQKRKKGEIEIYPWKAFLEELWDGKII